MTSKAKCSLLLAAAASISGWILLTAQTGTNRITVEIDKAPIRVIEDDAPTFAAVAVDSQHDEIILQDENLFQILVYDRMANTPPTATLTEPKRILGGSQTKIEFNCGLYVDPMTGDIYSVNNDTMDTMVVFERGLDGNVPPSRALHTPHGTYGIAVDEIHQELFLTIEHDSAFVTYRKEAAGEEPPLRLVQGDRTKLADPHGIVVDSENNWLFIANHGSTHRVADRPGRDAPPNWPLTRSYAIPGSGETWPPSITVYERTAQGNAAPLRIIQGPKTQLNWPAQMFLDQERGELYVANDGADSVLVFPARADGDVAPIRVIQGPSTRLSNPTGIWLDTENDEVVVSSMGNHSASTFPRTASGDVRPLRTIRAAPLGKMALAIGNPGGVAYDSKRDQLLVPNWVAHPQIAAFARLAEGFQPPARKIAGQSTLLARTMHDIRFDPIHDEIVVPNQFAQTILTFRGGINGEEPPIRVIQGSRTQLHRPDRLDIDPVHNEIFVPNSDAVLVFSREAQGNVAPIRIIRGPKTMLKGSSALVVDPVNDLLLVATQGRPPVGRQNTYTPTMNTLLVFNRTDSGDVAPRAVIQGDSTGLHLINQLQVHPPKGLVFVTQTTTDAEPEPEGTFVGVWSVWDSGDIPPLFKIAGPKTRLKKPRGVAINAEENEVFVADMRVNAVLTFHVPEIFE